MLLYLVIYSQIHNLLMNQLSDLEYFTDIRQSENDTNGIAFPVQRPPPPASLYRSTLYSELEVLS